MAKLSRREVENAANESESRYDHPFRRRIAKALLQAWNANADMRDVVFSVNENRDKLLDALAKMLTCFGRDSNGVLWACPIDASKDPPTKVECDDCPQLKEAREILGAKALPQPTEKP